MNRDMLDRYKKKILDLLNISHFEEPQNQAIDSALQSKYYLWWWW